LALERDVTLDRLGIALAALDALGSGSHTAHAALARLVD